MASVKLLPQGAVIQAINVAGLNIVQGFDTPAQYAKYNGPFFGETIGRVANRIQNATIKSLNGQSYTLAKNNGENSLHGGVVGWGKKEWRVFETEVKEVPGVAGLEGKVTTGYALRSEDGEEGFPGTVEVKVYYTTGVQKVEGKDVTVLAMEYEAELIDGADETVINMTNHSYFNLNGAPTINDTIVTLATDSYLPIDAGGIPTSPPTRFPTVTAATPFTLGATDPNIDDCFVLDPSKASSIPIDSRAEPLRLNISAHHPDTGIHLEVLSTEPAFQFYTGKYIDVPAVDGLPARGQRSGFCCEPGRYVNAVNEERWKGQVVLKKGEEYGARIVYRAWKE